MNKPYFCNFDYYATGEGRVMAFAVIISENKENAIEQFLNKIDRNCEYFRQGVECLDISIDENKQRMKDSLLLFLNESRVNHLMEAENKQALFDLFYHQYMNFS